MNTKVSHLILSFMTLLLLVVGNVQPVAAQEATADLALTKSADRKYVKIGHTITFTITVTNLGPDTATGIYFGDSLPDPLNFVSSSCSGGTISAGACAVESLAVGESATITLVATPISNPAQSERRFTNTAFIAESTSFDPNPHNNTASLHLRIVGNTH